MAALAVASSPAFAASQTWDGAASGVWDTSALNWGGAAFTSSNDALFSGTPTNNVTTATGLTIGAITLDNTFTGSVTMSGANTVSGATTISGGTLTLTNAGGLGTSAITVNNGGTATINVGAATVANAFSGAGILNTTLPATSGTLTLSGDLSGFTGTLNVGIGSGGGKLAFSTATQGNVISSSATINVATNGTLFVASALNYGSSLFLNGGTTGEALGQLRIEGGATWTGNITLNANSTIGGNSGTGTISGVIAGSGFGFTKVGGSTLVLSNTNTYTGGTTISVGTLQLGSGGTAGALSTSSTITNNANLTINRSNAVAQGTDFSGSAITGSGSFTQAGTGTTTLNAANTYTGATTVSAGTLKAGVASVANTSGAFGNNSAVTLANVAGATLDITGFNTQIGSLTGGGTTGGNVTLGAATLTVGGNNTSPAAYAGVISGTNGVLAKIGTGTLALNNANTYTGGTTISAGTITFTNASSFGTGAITSNGGTIRLLGTNDLITTNNLVVNSATTLDVSVLKNWTFNGNISGSGDITRGTGATSSLYLGGDNSGYTGTFTIQNNGNSVVRFAAASAGSENAKWVDSNTTAGRVSVEFGTGTLKFGSLTGAGGLSGGAFAGTKTIEVGNLGLNETYSGAISETSGDPMAVSKVGTGTWTLSGANSYTGATTVSAGTLSVSSLANGGSNSNIGKSTNVAGNLILNGGTLQYTGAAVSTDRLFSLQSSSTIDASGASNAALNFTNTGAMGFNGGTAAKTLTLTGTSTGANTLAAIISDNTGATSVTKSGAGTWVLSGANTYTGATTVNAGTLALGSAGSLASTAYTIASGAIFNTSAKTSYDLTGIATTMGVGASTAGRFTGPSGALTFGGTLALNFSTSALTNGQTYTLFSFGSETGNFTSVAATGSITDTFSRSGNVWTNGDQSSWVLSLDQSTGVLSVTASAIPEPATYAAIFGALALGMGLIRRRCQSAV
ncbi:MAG: autotransporter-associated beta strand repeat-containing protein [Verrucomicrobia bacterium]|nr:autotransporter-associated beta strand repeat-containing protein [Verrucomicrobiota bacterium]